MAQMEKILGEQASFSKATDWTTATKRSMEGVVNAQTELWEQVQATNQHWLDWFNAESKLGADFASKLASAHTIPEAVSVYQEFGRRQFEMIAEDATHFIGEAQKAMQNSVRLFTKGWPGGIST